MLDTRMVTITGPAGLSQGRTLPRHDSDDELCDTCEGDGALTAENAAGTVIVVTCPDCGGNGLDHGWED